jgi:hypothetical protein
MDVAALLVAQNAMLAVLHVRERQCAADTLCISTWQRGGCAVVRRPRLGIQGAYAFNPRAEVSALEKKSDGMHVEAGASHVPDRPSNLLIRKWGREVCAAEVFYGLALRQHLTVGDEKSTRKYQSANAFKRSVPPIIPYTNRPQFVLVRRCGQQREKASRCHLASPGVRLRGDDQEARGLHGGGVRLGAYLGGENGVQGALVQGLQRTRHHVSSTLPPDRPRFLTLGALL